MPLEHDLSMSYPTAKTAIDGHLLDRPLYQGLAIFDRLPDFYAASDLSPSQKLIIADIFSQSFPVVGGKVAYGEAFGGLDYTMGRIPLSRWQISRIHSKLQEIEVIDLVDSKLARLDGVKRRRLLIPAGLRTNLTKPELFSETFDGIGMPEDETAPIPVTKKIARNTRFTPLFVHLHRKFKVFSPSTWPSLAMVFGYINRTFHHARKWQFTSTIARRLGLNRRTVRHALHVLTHYKFIGRNDMEVYRPVANPILFPIDEDSSLDTEQSTLLHWFDRREHEANEEITLDCSPNLTTLSTDAPKV